jgi:hypothetical protein
MVNSIGGADGCAGMVCRVSGGRLGAIIALSWSVSVDRFAFNLSAAPIVWVGAFVFVVALVVFVFARIVSLPVVVA